MKQPNNEKNISNSFEIAWKNLEKQLKEKKLIVTSKKENKQFNEMMYSNALLAHNTLKKNLFLKFKNRFYNPFFYDVLG